MIVRFFLLFFAFQNVRAGILERDRTVDDIVIQKTLSTEDRSVSLPLPFFMKSFSIFNNLVENDKTGERYEIKARIGELHDRINDPNIALGSDYVLFLGGSNTFGLWLEDDQTIPYLVQKKIGSKQKVFNLACGGCSLAYMYYIVRNSKAIEKLKSKKGILIYNFFDFHILRDNCLPPELLWNRGYVPSFDYVDQKLEYKNLCSEQLRVKLTLFSNSMFQYMPFLKWFLPKNAKYHDIIQHQHIAYTIKLYSEIIRELGGTNQVTPYLLFNPMGIAFDKSKMDDMTELAKKEGIISIWVDEKWTTRDLVFKFDKHYNQKGAEALAHFISRKIFNISN